ncbi:MAG: epoxyqueuosine reductase QueH [Saccharofermentans sp.]|nr:epoxyqueuosine reductase QueH [Saccharofermentans sp.]
MSLLLHACCGPCAMYPLELLTGQGKDLEIFWYNPNIHPEFEWNRRYENLQIAADHYKVSLIKGDDSCEEEYWLSKTYLEEFETRCDMCYDMRMDAIAKFASENGFDSFSTTLLVSPYQQHDKIANIAETKARKYNVDFEYIDFRPGFRHGQDLAREIGLYRQKFCGCIFSLEESKFRDKIYRSFEEG